MIVFQFGPGRHPIGLKLGIVNKEVIDDSDCTFFMQQNISYLMDDRECQFDHASCHFINEIHDDDAIKVFYKTYEDAFVDAKKGKLVGIVTMRSNFSQSLMDFTFNFSANSIDFSEITVNLDQSDLQISTFIRGRLFGAYERFSKKLLRGCDINENVSSYPIKLNTIYGKMGDDFKRHMISNVFLQLSQNNFYLIFVL